MKKRCSVDGGCGFFLRALLTMLAISCLAMAVQADLKSALQKAGEQLSETTEQVGEKLEEATDELKGKMENKDPEQLAKEANTQLRNAEKLMFGGKKDKAITELKAAAQNIKALKEAAPEHKQLPTLESKANKLKKDLERRTGQTINLYGEEEKAAEKAAPEAKKEEKAAPSKVEKLPYHAREQMSELDKVFRSIDAKYRMVESYQERKEPAEQWLKKLDGVEEEIKRLQPILDEAKAKAAEEGVTAHPDFDAAQAKIDEQPKRLEEARSGATKAAEAAEAAEAGVTADVEQLGAEYDRLREKYFNKASGVAIYANDIEPVKELLALIEEFEKDEMAKAKSTVEQFASKYGSTSDEIKQKVNELGYEGNRQAHLIIEEFQNGIANVAKTKQAEYEDIIKRATDRIEGLPKMHDFYRYKGHKDIQEWMELAMKFASDKEQANAKSAEVEQKLKADQKAFLEKVDKAEWPGNSKGKIADAALSYFKESADWAKRPTEARIPLGVSVRGDWSVQKTNILGNPIMYGIPVYIAVQLESDKADNIARVFNVTMRTAEGAGVKKEPPFTSITVGDSWFIRADKVK